MKPIVMHIVASGMGAHSYPIEVGVVLEDGGSYCVLVKPEPKWKFWDAEAEKTHGLSREILFKRGQSVSTVAHQLNTLLDGRAVYSNAWAQDAVWLDLLFKHAGQQRNFKIESLRTLLTEQQFSHWRQAETDVLAVLRMPRRRASADARLLQMVIEQCTETSRSVELA